MFHLISMGTVSKKDNEWGRGAAKHRGKFCASHPAAPRLILGIANNFSEELFIDVDEINPGHF